MREGMDLKNIVQCLKPKTVQPGYVYHTWTPGMYIVGVKNLKPKG